MPGHWRERDEGGIVVFGYVQRTEHECDDVDEHQNHGEPRIQPTGGVLRGEEGVDLLPAGHFYIYSVDDDTTCSILAIPQARLQPCVGRRSISKYPTRQVRIFAF